MRAGFRIAWFAGNWVVLVGSVGGKVERPLPLSVCSVGLPSPRVRSLGMRLGPLLPGSERRRVKMPQRIVLIDWPGLTGEVSGMITGTGRLLAIVIVEGTVQMGLWY